MPAARRIRESWIRPIQIIASAISLNVDDPSASADFVKRHFGFKEEMAADGFVSLAHPSAGFNLVYLRVGLPTFKPAGIAGHHADGLLVVFVVDDVDAEYQRLIAEGAEIVTPLETEEWGERFFQVSDPCGVVYQLVTWTRRASEQGAPSPPGRASFK